MIQTGSITLSYCLFELYLFQIRAKMAHYGWLMPPTVSLLYQHNINVQKYDFDPYKRIFN